MFNLTADTLVQGMQAGRASAHHGFAGDAQRLLAAKELIHNHLLVLVLLVVLEEPASQAGTKTRDARLEAALLARSMLISSGLLA